MLSRLWRTLAQRRPSDLVSGRKVVQPDLRSLQIGLPWQLPYFKILNGAHPLVDSFVRGNDAVNGVMLERVPQPDPGDVQSVLVNLASQVRMIEPDQVSKYVSWIGLLDQLAIAAQASDFETLFLHTTPLYCGDKPWIFHFESFNSLFMPFVLTGFMSDMNLKSQGFFDLVKSRFESDDCRHIFSHMRVNIEIVRRVFDSQIIADKLHHVPLGIRMPPESAVLAKHDAGGPLKVFFTNSLHHDEDSFFLRGGHHLLKAFLRLRREGARLDLTILSSISSKLDQLFSKDDLRNVTWISHRISDGELEALLAAHHVFALPAAGLHSYSLLRALAYGCVPLVSDAFGYEEYVEPIRESVLSITGVRAQVYRLQSEGWMADNYRPFVKSGGYCEDQIYALLAQHLGRRNLKEFAARNAQYCRQNFDLEISHQAFNKMLRL